MRHDGRGGERQLLGDNLSSRNANSNTSPELKRQKTHGGITNSETQPKWSNQTICAINIVELQLFMGDSTFQGGVGCLVMRGHMGTLTMLVQATSLLATARPSL